VEPHDPNEIIKRPEFVLDEENYKHYVTEGVYPDNVVLDKATGETWLPVRDRQVRKKLRVNIKVYSDE
jgi:hypothetical protein